MTNSLANCQVSNDSRIVSSMVKSMASRPTNNTALKIPSQTLTEDEIVLEITNRMGGVRS